MSAYSGGTVQHVAARAPNDESVPHESAGTLGHFFAESFQDADVNDDDVARANGNQSPHTIVKYEGMSDFQDREGAGARHELNSHEPNVASFDPDAKNTRVRGRPRGVKDSRPRSRRTREELQRLKSMSGRPPLRRMSEEAHTAAAAVADAVVRPPARSSARPVLTDGARLREVVYPKSEQRDAGHLMMGAGSGAPMTEPPPGARPYTQPVQQLDDSGASRQAQSRVYEQPMARQDIQDWRVNGLREAEAEKRSGSGVPLAMMCMPFCDDLSPVSGGNRVCRRCGWISFPPATTTSTST